MLEFETFVFHSNNISPIYSGIICHKIYPMHFMLKGPGYTTVSARKYQALI